MKIIVSKSYIEAQQQTIRLDQSRLRAPQNNSRIAVFQNAFKTLSLPSIAELNLADAMALRQIQTAIRQKLRFFGVDPGY